MTETVSLVVQEKEARSVGYNVVEATWLGRVVETFEQSTSEHAIAIRQLTQYSTSLQTPNLMFLTRSAKAIALSLLPSPLIKSTARRNSNPRKNNSIAAIDGLRGLACLIVFNSHFSYNYSWAFVAGSWEGWVWPIQWPFIHLFWSGRSMVYVFWVISGYTLSLKPLKQLKSGELQAFQKTIASSLIRRGFRLYLPTLIAVQMIGFLTWAGIYEPAMRNVRLTHNVLHFREPPPERYPELSTQLLDAAKKGMGMFQIWDWYDKASAGDYNTHYWTISIQFRTALFLFLILTAASRMKAAYRTTLIATFLLLSLFLWQRGDVSSFFGGMFLAELDSHTPSTSALPWHTHQLSEIPKATLSPGLTLSLQAAFEASRRRIFRHQMLYLSLIILGIYFCSIPMISIRQQPYSGFIFYYFPLLEHNQAAPIRSIGAILLTYGVIHSTHVQPLFTSRIAAYLGKISYSLYIVHGVILKSVLYAVLPSLYATVGAHGPADDGSTTAFQFVGVYVMGFMLTLPLALWTADVFWRMVDVPTARFTRWVEGTVSVD